MRYKIIAVILLLASLSGLLAGCAPVKKTPLIVFAAGSLIKPFDDLEKAFEAQNPDVDVQNEYHGSIQVIRHATDLHEKIDVVATADQVLIPMLMYEQIDPQTGKPYSDSSIQFATNRLGLAYTAKSKYADEITPENWMDILTREDVKVGLSDPRFDASGYRTLMIFKLAEQVYGRDNLFAEMVHGQFKKPLAVSNQGDVKVIRVPEVLETSDQGHIVMRGSSVMLIALLESGDLDYAFEYESVIQQHQLNLIELPDSLNLGSPEQVADYQKVEVILDFQRFATVKPVFQGDQIRYGITIPSNAPHPEVAKRFVAFLLGPEGREIMRAAHHPLLDPLVADGYENLPPELQALCVPGD